MADDGLQRIAARLAELAVLLRGGNLTAEERQAAWDEHNQLTSGLLDRREQRRGRCRAAAAAGINGGSSSASGDSGESGGEQAAASQQAEGQGAAGDAPADAQQPAAAAPTTPAATDAVLQPRECRVGVALR